MNELRPHIHRFTYQRLSENGMRGGTWIGRCRECPATQVVSGVVLNSAFRRDGVEPARPWRRCKTCTTIPSPLPNCHRRNYRLLLRACWRHA